MTRCSREHCATVFKRVFSGSVRHFIEEGLGEEGVIAVADAAPESDGHVRVAHRVLDQLVGRGVGRIAERAHRGRVDALVDALGAQQREDRGAGDGSSVLRLADAAARNTASEYKVGSQKKKQD